MLRNLLSIRVPSLAAVEVEAVMSTLLAKEGIPRNTIAEWIFHPGGRDVLSAIRDRLGLKPAQLRHSGKVLRQFGNLSSPSVYFVLQEALGDSAQPGYWWLSSFGAGFSCHGALLKVEG
jgi:predicted naringenin-chalcone synthase